MTTNKDGSPRGHWLKVARSNGISQQVYNNRVYRKNKDKRWTPEMAATTPVKQHPPISENIDRLMLKMRDNGMSIEEISDEFAISAHGVNLAIDRARVRKAREEVV